MKPTRAGLLCAGGVSRSFVARLPALLKSTIFVKAGSLRVARRIANSLRAGRAVDHNSPLAACDAIWIAVPEDALDRTLTELASQISLAGIMVVVCDTVRDSASLRGVHAATILAIAPEDRTLVVEGDARTLRYLRRVAAADKRKLVEIRPASKPLFLAGLHLATDLSLPWIAAAVESLRAAGFSRMDATRLVEELGGRTLRSYGKAGLKAWNPSAAEELRRALSVKPGDARLAKLYRVGIEQALAFFGDSPGS